MHTVAGGVRAIFQMLAGAAFRGRQIETNYNIEQCLNGHWSGGFLGLQMLQIKCAFGSLLGCVPGVIQEMLAYPGILRCFELEELSDSVVPQAQLHGNQHHCKQKLAAN